MYCREQEGEILGHMAPFPDDLFGYVPELAAGFVHPHFRGGGSFRTGGAAIRDADAEGFAGICGMAVTFTSAARRLPCARE